MSFSTAIPASSGVGIDRDDTDLARATMRRVSLRLLPFLFLIYIFNFLDRTNVAIAALQMNRDLGFSATAYGFGAGIFSLGYALFEVPSNLVLARNCATRSKAAANDTRPFNSSAQPRATPMQKPSVGLQ